MAAAQKKAVDLMAKGEKCLTKFSFFGGGSQKYEDAAGVKARDACGCVCSEFN